MIYLLASLILLAVVVSAGLIGYTMGRETQQLREWLKGYDAGRKWERNRAVG